MTRPPTAVVALICMAGLAGAPGCHERIEGSSVEVTVKTQGPANAWVTVDSVEIIECAQPAWSLQLISTAHAHGDDTSTKLGTTTVLPLDGGAAAFGTLEPAAGDFCEVRVTFGPADGDAEGLQDTGMQGLTFKLGPITIADSVEAEASLPTPMEVSGGDARALTVTVTLDGAPPGAAAAREALRTAVTAVSAVAAVAAEAD